MEQIREENLENEEKNAGSRKGDTASGEETAGNRKGDTASGEESAENRKGDTASGEESAGSRKGNMAGKEENAGDIKEGRVNKGEKPEGKKERKAARKAGTEKTESVENSGKGKAKRKKPWIPICILLALLAGCSCAYIATAMSYKEKFLPGTWINGMDCTELDGAQVAGMLENQLQAYCLDVTGRDYGSGEPGTLLGQVTAEDIHLTYSENSRAAVDGLLAQQNVFTWLYRKLSKDTYSFQLSDGVAYDAEQLEGIVKGWEACQPRNMKPPRNASISDYSEKVKGYEVIPEEEGTKFDVRTLLQWIDAAVLSHETFLDLEEKDCYEEPAVRQDAPELTGPVETANKWLGTKVTYDWNGEEVVVDVKLLKGWIAMKKGKPVLDEDAVAAFVKEQAEEHDTYGRRRNFVTTHGVELSLPSGYYGWLTDKEAETKELTELIYQGKSVSREPVYASTARKKGMSDIGNSYVEVDLTHQHLYLYEGGTVIFETDFVSGSMSSTSDCMTPAGVFGISYKTTNAVLRGANYETPVNYWMPFYGNYGMHDATWRSEFGGQIYITNGSHGCVNLPLDAAATIYPHMSAGFPVICYYYQVDPLAGQNAEEEWYEEDDEDE